MLWLALHLPSLSLEAFCATLPAGAESGKAKGGLEAAGVEADDARAEGPCPVALVAEHRISDCNAAAADRGVRPGQKRATALALAPRLLLGEADAARDATAFRAVAHAALTFTPSVTLLDGPATVLMEVQASLRLFGGLASLHGLLREALAPLSHRVQIAAAPTALGAAVLARWPRDELIAAMRAARTAAAVQKDAGHEGPTPKSSAQKRSARKGFAATDPSAFDPVLGPHALSLHALERLLDPAPVWLLGPGREHWEALQGMGLRTLADLRALPRAGLARRFGEGLLLDLDRALGEAPDPRRWIELPARFESRLELHQRADSAEQVLAAASVLLARLVVWAQARHGRIAAFTLAMQHEPRHTARGGSVPATELRIEMAEPALDAAHLQLLLRERLARIVLAAPTLELRLRCRDLVHGAPPNGELFPTRASEAIGLARLLERLRARLGDAQVQRLEPVADHRPERGSRGVPALAPPKAQAAVRVAQPSVRTPSQPDLRSRSSPEEPAGRKALPLHRPVWLLPTPVPLPERHGLPVLDGQPLQLVSGPERIEAGWWDGAPAARDYFIAMAADGSLVWVWRNRVPSSAGSNGPGEAAERGQPDADVPWMLQGRFG